MTGAEAYAWLAVHAINTLPAIDHPREPEKPCCAECCGPCGALLELADLGSLNTLVFAAPTVAAHVWWVDGGVDPEYLAARITRGCEICDDDTAAAHG